VSEFVKVLLIGAAWSKGSEDLIAAESRAHDLVIAVDGGADLCRAAGVVPDLVVGDLDSIDSVERERLEQTGIEFEIHPAEKDETDLELAIEAARRRDAGAVTATGVLVARLDHTLAALGALARAADLTPRFVEPVAEGWLLSPSGRQSVEIVGSGEVFSVIGMTEESVVDVSGAKWPLAGAVLRPLSGLGVSNLVEKDRAVVHVRTGTVLVVRTAGDAIQ
jgi:thiamine pyrophosphokinase